MIGNFDENKGSEEHGVILRLLNDILAELEIRRKEDPDLCIYVNFIENASSGHHNSSIVVDLLEDYDHCKKGPRDSMLSTYSTCSVRSTTSTKSNNHKGKVTITATAVEGMLDVEITNVKDAFNLISYGTSKRKIRSTKLNSDSSRSHAIFYINLGRKVVNNGAMSLELLNRITVADLAGSEKIKDVTNPNVAATKEQTAETIFINTSLFQLTHTIAEISGKTTQVRNSQIGRSDLNRLVLRDLAQGGCKVFAIFTVSRLLARVFESYQTMIVSANLMGVKTIDLEDGRTVSKPVAPSENPEEFNIVQNCINALKAEKIARQEDEFKIREQVLREAEFSLQMRDNAAREESMTIKLQLQNKIDVARKETQLYFQKYEQAITHKEYYKNKLATFQSKLEDQNLIIGKLQIERDEYKEKYEALKSETENGSLISEKLKLELEAANEQLQSARKERDTIEKTFYSRTQQYESDKRGTIDRYEQEKRNIYELAKKEIETLRAKLQESESKTEKQREYIRVLKEKTAQLIQAQQEEKKESSSILSKFSAMFSSKHSKQSKEDALQLNVAESSDLKRKHDLKEDERSKVESPNKKTKVEEEEVTIETEESDVVPTKKRTKRRFLKK